MQVEEFANRASHLYQQHGSPESAASALDKASKVVEQKHPEIALRFYQRALEISMVSTDIWYTNLPFDRSYDLPIRNAVANEHKSKQLDLNFHKLYI